MSIGHGCRRRRPATSYPFSEKPCTSASFSTHILYADMHLMLLAGRLESVCRAYAWEKCIILKVLQLRAWGLKICTDLCLGLLSSVIILLQSNDSFRGCILELQGGDPDFLIIGACITALDLSDDADSLTTGLSMHVKVSPDLCCAHTAHASKTFAKCLL